MLHSDPPPLQGPRVRLQPFSTSDITPAYIGWLNDPLVVRFSNQRLVRHDQASCERYFASFANSHNRFLSVRLVATGQAIGTATAYFAPTHGTVDVGILLGDRDYWGRGYGQEAWDLLLAWLMGHAGVRKLTAGAVACNAPMLQLMERSGMALEAVRQAQEIVDGQAQDLLYYARFTGA
jgi:RimJ/RimL family protein N-acetyltransferase